MRALAMFLFAACLLVPDSGRAGVFLSQPQALALAFPAGTRVERQTFFLKPEQIKQIKTLSGAEEVQPLVIRYVGRQSDGSVIGYAFFDAHRVRTLPESVMFVVSAAGTISRVEILSFNEPGDYLPKRRWLDQLHSRKLDDDLAVNRAIRPISGATLSGRAVVNASRKILAVQQVLGAAAAAR